MPNLSGGKTPAGGRICLLRHGRAFRPARPATVRPAAFGSVRGLRYLCRMKTLYIVLGSISLALGILGIFLPLLPTTPFLLLTAALYFKGSPRLYNWLLNHRHFGPYIRNFRENKAIPLRAKIISLVLMWGTMLYCIFFLIPFIWVKILLGLIAAGVTYHILSFKTLK